MTFDIKRFAKQVQKIDDALGYFSDHEGDSDGPTVYLYNRGKERWERQCEQAIDLHMKAVRLWQRALKESRKGRPPTPTDDRPLSEA